MTTSLRRSAHDDDTSGPRRVARWLDRNAVWLALTACLALTFAIYWRALGFTLFFDDPFDLTRVEGRGYWTLLSSAEGYQYYRPVPAVLWKALHDLQGHYHLATLHAVPLVCHALSGWLLYLLARRLGAGHWALVPAVLFLTTPFHYQTVAIIGPTAHTLAAVFMLASVNLYLAARLDGSQTRFDRRHALSLAATVLALWSHESGVLIVAFIALAEAFALYRARLRRPSPWVLAHAAAAVAFYVVWSTVDKLPTLERTNLSELHPKTLFFLQGFTYPLSAQLVWLEERLGLSVGVLEAGLLALALGFGAFALAAWRSGRRDLLLVPLAACAVAAVASVPSLLRLSWGYVQDGPRLLYLGAIGSALFWGLLPSLRFGGRAGLVWRVATLALLALVVAQSWRFVDVRLDMFAKGSEAIDGVVAAGERHQGQGLLVVNLPSWFAMNRYEYRYGHYGVQLVPDYVGLDRVAYANSPIKPLVSARSVAWQADVSGGAFPFGPHGVQAPPEELDALLREGRQLVTVVPDGDRYLTRDVGRLRPGAAEELPGNAGRLGAGVVLDTARVAVTSDHPDLLTVYLTWHVIEPPAAELDAVVELRDASGAVVFVYEGYPLDGMSAPRLWQAGDKVNDSVAFPLPPDGDYTIWAGLRDRDTGAMLPAADIAGNDIPSGLLPLGGARVADGHARALSN